MTGPLYSLCLACSDRLVELLPSPSQSCQWYSLIVAGLWSEAVTCVIHNKITMKLKCNSSALLSATIYLKWKKARSSQLDNMNTNVQCDKDSHFFHVPLQHSAVLSLSACGKLLTLPHSGSQLSEHCACRIKHDQTRKPPGPGGVDSESSEYTSFGRVSFLVRTRSEDALCNLFGLCVIVGG